MEVRPIDANALLKLIEVKGKEYGVTVANRCTFRDILKLARPLDYAPVRHGEWDTDRVPFCNRCEWCGAVVDRQAVKRGGWLRYCPNCGTKMDGGTDHA